MMNPHTQQKKSDEPKSVDQMTEEEQLAHAIKLSSSLSSPSWIQVWRSFPLK